MWRKIGNILMLFIIGVSGFANEVTVEATVNSDEIGLNDTLIYTLSITCGFDVEPSQIKFPDFQGFKKLSQSQSSSVSIVIGGGQAFSKVKRYDIQLLPNRTGIIEIKPAVVVVKGKEYRTTALKVSVLPASKSTSQAPRQHSIRNFFQSPFDIDELPFEKKISDDDIVLHAVVDKTSVYVGEEIVFSVYLYTAVQIYDIEQITLPKFENFWVEDIYSPQRFTSEQKRIGNRTYNVYLLKRKAIFPNKEGIYEIEPSSIVLNVVSGFSQRRIVRQTQGIKIDVRPLPKQDMPVDFPSYNVGNYRVYYELSPQRQPMDKPFVLKIVVEGIGNINAFTIPKLKDNPELRFYDPVVNTEIQTDNRVYKGKKSFEYLIFAKRIGKIQLPVIEILFFKPDTESYERVALSGLFIEATESESSGSVVKKIDAVDRFDRPASIRFVSSIKRGFNGLNFELFLLLSFIFPGIYMMFVVKGVIRTLLIYWGFDSEVAKSKRRLRKSVENLNRNYKKLKVVEFSDEVYTALAELLYIKFGINIRGLTREQLKRALIDNKVDQLLIDELEHILDVCEMIKFAKSSFNSSEIEDIYQRFNSFIQKCRE
ncbi:MAG: BatD family protein [Deltaproteobacteria bacterium]|nr:BatD family protein [Deltaproteobacteria bacterium]